MLLGIDMTSINDNKSEDTRMECSDHFVRQLVYIAFQNINILHNGLFFLVNKNCKLGDYSNSFTCLHFICYISLHNTSDY